MKIGDKVCVTNQRSSFLDEVGYIVNIAEYGGYDVHLENEKVPMVFSDHEIIVIKPVNRKGDLAISLKNTGIMPVGTVVRIVHHNMETDVYLCQAEYMVIKYTVERTGSDLLFIEVEES